MHFGKTQYRLLFYYHLGLSKNRWAVETIIVEKGYNILSEPGGNTAGVKQE
jgi:hypothetical protein